MVRAADKKSPREAVEFVLQLLKVLMLSDQQYLHGITTTKNVFYLPFGLAISGILKTAHYPMNHDTFLVVNSCWSDETSSLQVGKPARYNWGVG